MTMTVAALRFKESGGWSAALPDLDSSSTLLLVFGGRQIESRTDVFRRLRLTYTQSVILGCSTAGEILGSEVSDGTITVCLARFQSTRLVRAEARIERSGDSRAAGEQLGQRLAQEGLRSVLVLSDGLVVNGSEVARGMNTHLPKTAIVTGGLAADGSRFERTWTLNEAGIPEPGLVTAVGLVGEKLRVRFGSRGGWDVFGPQRLVTRSEGNVLFELDGTPALELYKKYLGERAAGLPATALLFPLELRSSPSSPSVVRTVLSVNEDEATMTFAGDVPEGSLAQLMRANFDRLIDGAASAAEGLADAPSVPGVCIAVSCVGRRLVLGERTEEEAEAVFQTLPQGTVQVGMYSYGELSPQGVGSCDLHNQTMTLTLVQEVD